jgi:hypothetical protein
LDGWKEAFTGAQSKHKTHFICGGNYRDAARCEKGNSALALISRIDNGKRREELYHPTRDASFREKQNASTYLFVVAAVGRRGTVAVAAVATVGAQSEVDCGTQPGTEKVHTQRNSSTTNTPIINKRNSPTR